MFTPVEQILIPIVATKALLLVLLWIGLIYIMWRKGRGTQA